MLYKTKQDSLIIPLQGCFSKRMKNVYEKVKKMHIESKKLCTF